MISRLFERLYNKIIVNIVVKRTSSDVYIEVLSNKNVIKHAQKNFNTTSLNDPMIEFIQEYIKESPYYYISFLNTSNEQGALSGCDKKSFSKKLDLNAVEYKCYDKSWMYYASRVDLLDTQKVYKKIGLDYIFSPYTILGHFFKDKISSNLAMFILMQDSYMSLCVFEKGKLLFSEYLDMQTNQDATEELLSQDLETTNDMNIEDTAGIDLEDVDVLDNMESLEDIDAFGDIEDLDSIEEIDEFSENQDIEEELYEAEEEITEESDGDTFNEDYQRFSLIHTSLGHYYNGTEYKSEFIENVYIADGIGLSSDLKRYLEEEMFLNVYIRQMNIAMELSELVKLELKL